MSPYSPQVSTARREGPPLSSLSGLSKNRPPSYFSLIQYSLLMVKITDHRQDWQFLRTKGFEYVKCKMKIKFTSSSLHSDDTAISLCAYSLDEHCDTHETFSNLFVQLQLIEPFTFINFKAKNDLSGFKFYCFTGVYFRTPHLLNYTVSQGGTFMLGVA